MTLRHKMAGVPFKICIPSEGLQVGVVARDFTHLKEVLEARYALGKDARLYLEDGTLVCDQDYFELLEPQTKLTVVVQSGEKQGPTLPEKRPLVVAPADSATSLPFKQRRISRESLQHQRTYLNARSHLPSRPTAVVNTNNNSNSAFQPDLVSCLQIRNVAGNVPMQPSPTHSPVTSPEHSRIQPLQAQMMQPNTQLTTQPLSHFSSPPSNHTPPLHPFQQVCFQQSPMQMGVQNGTSQTRTLANIPFSSQYSVRQYSRQLMQHQIQTLQQYPAEQLAHLHQSQPQGRYTRCTTNSSHVVQSPAQLQLNSACQLRRRSPPYPQASAVPHQGLLSNSWHPTQRVVQTRTGQRFVLTEPAALEQLPVPVPIAQLLNLAVPPPLVLMRQSPVRSVQPTQHQATPIPQSNTIPRQPGQKETAQTTPISGVVSIPESEKRVKVVSCVDPDSHFGSTPTEDDDEARLCIVENAGSTTSTPCSTPKSGRNSPAFCFDAANPDCRHANSRPSTLATTSLDASASSDNIIVIDSDSEDTTGHTKSASLSLSSPDEGYCSSSSPLESVADVASKLPFADFEEHQEEKTTSCTEIGEGCSPVEEPESAMKVDESVEFRKEMNTTASDAVAETQTHEDTAVTVQDTDDAEITGALMVRIPVYNQNDGQIVCQGLDTTCEDTCEELMVSIQVCQDDQILCKGLRELLSSRVNTSDEEGASLSGGNVGKAATSVPPSPVHCTGERTVQTEAAAKQESLVQVEEYASEEVVLTAMPPVTPSALQKCIAELLSSCVPPTTEVVEGDENPCSDLELKVSIPLESLWEDYPHDTAQDLLQDLLQEQELEVQCDDVIGNEVTLTSEGLESDLDREESLVDQIRLGLENAATEEGELIETEVVEMDCGHQLIEASPESYMLMEKIDSLLSLADDLSKEDSKTIKDFVTGRPTDPRRGVMCYYLKRTPNVCLEVNFATGAWRAKHGPVSIPTC